MDFAKFIGELDRGLAVQRLGEELAKIVEAVSETHQKGTLKITLTVRQEGMQCRIDCESEPKVPKHPHHGTLFHWGNRPGELSRTDPRQLPLRALPPLSEPKEPVTNGNPEN